jgi:hypothetical protein
MMVLILILSFAAVYIFIKQYKKEMRERKARADEKAARKNGAKS